MRPDVTVSLIGMDHRDVLRDCLASLLGTTLRHSLEVFVVDNVSSDGTVEMVERDFPQVHLIRNTSVLGFSSNNNLVLTRASGRFTLLLNDDTLVLPEAVDTLVDFMDAHPEAAVAGGQLLNPDGSLQVSFGGTPHPVLEAFHPFTDRWRFMTPASSEPFEAAWVCGASFMIRREVVQAVGLLDPAFDPGYSEEIDWCYRIRQGGGRIFAVPAARFVHYGGMTLNKMGAARVELLYRKRALYFLKHGGMPAKSVFKVALWLASLAKLLAWIVLLPFRTERARAEIPLHWRTVQRALWL